jgi:hypothetical protein
MKFSRAAGSLSKIVAVRSFLVSFPDEQLRGLT